VETLQLVYDHPWTTGILLIIFFSGVEQIVYAFKGEKDDDDETD